VVFSLFRPTGLEKIIFISLIRTLIIIIMQSFYIALFQAESLLKDLYIITPSHMPVHSRTFSTAWGAYSRAAVRNQQSGYTSTNATTTS
jgi:hypothetical protein